MSVMAGHNVVLRCTAHGAPKPQLFWYLNGVRVRTDERVSLDSSGHLVIARARFEDAGKIHRYAGFVLIFSYIKM